MKQTSELETAQEGLTTAEHALSSALHKNDGSERSRLAAALEDYVKANRRYVESLHRALSSAQARSLDLQESEMATLARHVRDLWADKQRVVSSTANFLSKNKDFQQVHNALLKHIDQSWKCFQSLYVLMGGDIADLHRK